MNTNDLPEVWLRGPLPDMPALLQPAAHALLQAREELRRLLHGLPKDRLWTRPSGLASVGFHLQHLAGVLDRMATYAAGQPLNEAQLAYLAAEGRDEGQDVETLLTAWEDRVDAIVEQMRRTPESTLTDYRPVGRKALPSMVIGLLFHAAEHAQRHLGQVMVTARVVQGEMP